MNIWLQGDLLALFLGLLCGALQGHWRRERWAARGSRDVHRTVPVSTVPSSAMELTGSLRWFHWSWSGWPLRVPSNWFYDSTSLGLPIPISSCCWLQNTPDSCPIFTIMVQLQTKGNLLPKLFFFRKKFKFNTSNIFQKFSSASLQVFITHTWLFLSQRAFFTFSRKLVSFLNLKLFAYKSTPKIFSPLQAGFSEAGTVILTITML